MIKLLKFWPHFIVCIFCFTPVIWFLRKGDILINGVDTNFPLNPTVWFLRRLYVWNSISNAGSDSSSSTAGLFFHLIQFIPYKFGFNLQQVEIISLIFWFSLIIISAFILAKTLFDKKPLVWILFTVFYAFNIYLFNTWENVKVANLSLIASVPFAIAIIVNLQNAKISYLRGGIYTIIVAIILSGSGINPAYFLSFFFSLFIFTFAGILANLHKENFVKSLTGLLFVIILVIITNLFWIFPTTAYILRTITTSNSINSLGFVNWIDNLSMNTSILNVIRIQGAWDWYALDEYTKLPFYIPYAANYFSSFPFLVFSFLIPLLALSSFLFSTPRRSNLYITFGIMFILGIFLGVGTHEPTGLIFRFLADHLPFFSLFRSPWYIFSPLFILAIAGLISLFFYQLDERLQNFTLVKKKRFISIAAVVLLIVNLLYSYPLWTGKIFRPGREDTFYINFPRYVLDTGKWLELENREGRLIGYPDDRIEKFKWGYRGVDSVLHLLTDKEVIFVPLNETNPLFVTLIDELYKSLKKGQLDSLKSLTNKLNINSIFEKQDQDSLILALPENIKQLPSKNFGQWVFYDIQDDKGDDKINIPSNIYFGYPYIGGAKSLTVLGKKDIFLNPSDSVISAINDIEQSAHTILISENSQMQEYNNFKSSTYALGLSLRERNLNSVIFNVDIPEDGMYQPILEKYRIGDFGIDVAKNLEVLTNKEKSIWEIEKVSDSYIYFKQTWFKKGKNEVEVALQNKNLISNKDFKFIENIDSKIGNEIKIIQDNNFNYFTIRNQNEQESFCNYSFDRFDSLNDYLIQVKYKHIYGHAPKIIINQKINNQVVKKHIEQLPLSPEWDVFSFYYHPHDSNSKLDISLTAPYSKENPLGTKVAFTDLSMQRVFSNDLILVKRTKNNILSSADIKFKKISPVEYQGKVLEVKSGHILSFLENYSSNWELKLYDKNNNPLIIQPVHFSSNLYANAWYIKGTPEEYSFKIYYQPQKLFNIGLVISIGGVVVILLMLVIFKRYGR